MCIRDLDNNVFMTPRKDSSARENDIDLPGYAWDLLPYKNKPLDLYRAHFCMVIMTFKKGILLQQYTLFRCRFNVIFA